MSSVSSPSPRLALPVKAPFMISVWVPAAPVMLAGLPPAPVRLPSICSVVAAAMVTPDVASVPPAARIRVP